MPFTDPHHRVYAISATASASIEDNEEAESEKIDGSGSLMISKSGAHQGFFFLSAPEIISTTPSSPEEQEMAPADRTIIIDLWQRSRGIESPKQGFFGELWQIGMAFQFLEDAMSG